MVVGGMRRKLDFASYADENEYRDRVANDAFLGERDFVVRPLDERLGKVPDISAASLTEDGSPVLIIDVEDIARSIDSSTAPRTCPGLREPDQGRARRTLYSPIHWWAWWLDSQCTH